MPNNEVTRGSDKGKWQVLLNFLLKNSNPRPCALLLAGKIIRVSFT